MTDRITRKQLDWKVAYINEQLGRPDTAWTKTDNGITPNIGHIFIDHYSPGGNPYTYKLAEMMENGGERDWTNYRMKLQEFAAYLNGIIAILELQERNK